MSQTLQSLRMSLMFGVIFSCLVLPLASADYCTLEDESEGDDPTPEWNNFMNKLQELFEGTYTKRCKGNDEENVTIDKSSDFLWDLRFALYSDSQDGKTMNHCLYESGKDTCDRTDRTEFQECLKAARIAMTEVLDTWNDLIETELAKLAAAC